MPPFNLPSVHLEENIIAVLSYFDLFDYPLTLSEIQKLIPGNINNEQAIKKILTKNNNIESVNDYYFLKGRSHIVPIRQNRAHICEKLWKKVKRFVPLLQMVPFVRMVAVCNTLAFGSATEHSDIDLFIVTQKNRIFIARTLSTLLFSLLGIRRHGQKIAGRFCLSFYATEEALNLEPIAIPNDIYLLYWIKTLQPIFGSSTHEKFDQENKWVERFFPSQDKVTSTKIFSRLGPLKEIFLLKIQKSQEWLLKGKVGDFLEEKLYQMQLRRHHYNQKNLTAESSIIISKSILKFHNIDRRQEYLGKFRKNFRNYS